MSTSSSCSFNCVHSSGWDLPHLNSLVNGHLSLVILTMVVIPHWCGTQAACGSKSCELCHRKYWGKWFNVNQEQILADINKAANAQQSLGVLRKRYGILLFSFWKEKSRCAGGLKWYELDGVQCTYHVQENCSFWCQILRITLRNYLGVLDEALWGRHATNEKKNFFFLSSIQTQRNQGFKTMANYPLLVSSLKRRG